MDTDRTEQLSLLADDVVAGHRHLSWGLDLATRERGRRGVAAARQALTDAATRRAAAKDHASRAA